MTGSEIVAHLVVNCNVSIDISQIESLSLSDPLVAALFEAQRQKQDMEMERFALIAAVVANSVGNKTTTADFFNPSSVKTQEERRRQKEADLKSMFMRHNSALGK